MLGGSQESGTDPASGSLVPLVRELSRSRGAGRLLARVVGLGALGRGVARLMRAPMRFHWVATRFTRLHALVLRLARGRIRRSWLLAAGQPVMGLTTIGRMSGRKRSTTVTALCAGDRLATVGMNLGLERNPGWAHNLEANPDAWITLGGRTIPVRARKAVGDEWGELWARWVDVQPAAETWAEIAGRQVPIFVLEARASTD